MTTNKFHIATLKLFNAIQVEEKENTYSNQTMFFRALKSGFVLNQNISPSETVVKLVEDVLGIGGNKLNASFHKSWGKVATASDFQLWAEQIFHYITTYGFESMGIYDEAYVYIPAEQLDIPEVTEDIKLRYIQALTAEEVLDAVIKLGSSGIALSQETLDNIMVIIKENDYDYGFVSDIKNRELYTLLCDFYNIVPSEPMQYLRYVIAKLTGQSLVIKNKAMIGRIKQSDAKVLDKLILSAPDDLASIFFRFKPLFLAMKSISNNKTFFNRLRKQANVLHVPMNEDYLNTVTSQLKHRVFNMAEFEERIQGYSIWRKVRLATALTNRLNKNASTVVYKVRSGKGWADDFEWNVSTRNTQKVLDATLNSIADDIRPNVEDRTFYIPYNVCYALPATEKQFTGNVPDGTYVSVTGGDLIIGVHWYNSDGHRVDIDLSLMDTVSKFGWDRNYRNYERSVMFSGDVTDAPRPNGASEFFYLRDGSVTPKMLMANYYTHDEDYPVDCQFIVAHEKPKSAMQKNYMVNPNNIEFSQSLRLTERQTNIGLVLTVGDENRIYFSSTSVGDSITSRNDDVTTKAFEFYRRTALNIIELKTVLEMAGAIIVDDVSDADGDYTDLSINALDKNTIIGLLTVSE